jgi:iron complex outermembrane recepter protein
MKTIGKIACAGVSLLALSVSAQAQDASEVNDNEIVVTGTLIRGIAPGGSQTIGVSEEKIESIGAANTSDLVSAIPQAGTFNQVVAIRGSSNFSLAVNRPILRYLGFQSSSTASTLLLVDGHRLPGMGIQQSSPDVDAIAVGAIERVEVVTDGGSATYGSDAVGGVMNFITRKTFDGVEVKGSYGFGHDIEIFNAGVTAGTAWETGSAYVSYDFSHHDELFGRDRTWSRSLNWPLSAAAAGDPNYAGGAFDIGSSVNCATPNIFFSNTNTRVGLPALTAAGTNRCDNTEHSTFYPRETKHSVLGSLYLEPADNLSFRVKAYYVHRRNVSDGGPLTGDFTVPKTLLDGVTPNPVYIPVPGQNGAPCRIGGVDLLCQTAQISFAPLLGVSTPQVGVMEAWGITPTVKYDVGGGWQVNALFNYGRGKNTFDGQLINASPIGAAAFTFNPYNLSAPGNAAPLATALDWFQYGRATHDLYNARVIADGPLFRAPGGDLRVAIGAEWMKESISTFVTRSATRASINAAADAKVSRDVWSVFGEINLPIVGEENRGDGIYGLSVTASGRYDHYSDFGSTFNPKIGVNFEPVEWLRLRGNWGKAFQAPGMSDLASVLLGENVNPLPTTLRPFFDPATPVPVSGNNAWIIAVGGAKPGLQPQKATTWSVGFDIRPVGSSFAAGLTYYNIDFKGAITIAPINLPTFYKNFANNVVLYPAGNQAMLDYFNEITSNISAASRANLLATVGGASCATTQVASCLANVYAVMDGRTINQSVVKTDGLDFYLRYTHPTSFGDVYLDVNGNYILSLQQGGPTGVLDVNGIDPNHKFSMATTVGAHIGNLTAQVTWMTNDGFNVTPTAGNLQQSRVKGFNLFNLFFKYDVPGDSVIARDLSFTLHVDNVFDVDPPLLRGLSNSVFGAGNGFTLGRVFKIGVSKRFGGPRYEAPPPAPPAPPPPPPPGERG